MEQKLGSFEVLQTGKLSAGVILQAYVTNERIVAAKVGGQLDGGKALTVHFGLLGGIIGYFLDKRVQKKRAALRASFEEKPLDELLGLDAKNFEVRFDALEGAELKKNKLGFLGASKATLVLKRVGDKPLELTLQTAAAVADAVRALEQNARVQIDPKLRG